MPTNLVTEGRKLHGAGNGNANGANGNGVNGHGNREKASGKPQLTESDSTLALQEIKRLAQAARDEQFSERGRVENFEGYEREVVETVIGIFDTFVN